MRHLPNTRKPSKSIPGTRGGTTISEMSTDRRGTSTKRSPLSRRALEINPRYAEAHYNLAVIYYERKNYPLAIQHCDQAGKLGIVVDPKFLELLKPHRSEGAKKEVPQKEGAPEGSSPEGDARIYFSVGGQEEQFCSLRGSHLDIITTRR